MPEVRDHHLHEPDDATGLLEAVVLFELTYEFPEVRMEWVGVDHAGVKRLGRGGGEPHLVRLKQRVTVSRGHCLNFWFWRNVFEEALAKYVVELVAVWVDRGNRNGCPSRL